MAQQYTDIAKDSRLAEVKAGPAQTRYAATLAHGAVLSFAVMLVTYVLYVSGITEPLVPLEEMPKLWVHSAAEYRAAAHIPEGWGWLSAMRSSPGRISEAAGNLRPPSRFWRSSFFWLRLRGFWCRGSRSRPVCIGGGCAV